MKFTEVPYYVLKNFFSDPNLRPRDASTYFTITTTSSGGGDIFPSGSISCSAGSDVLFTFTPAEDYEVSDVIVDGVSQGAISSYTFTTVLENHTLHVVFVESITYYTITTSSTGIGSIEPSGSISCSAGSDVSIIITSIAPSLYFYITIDYVFNPQPLVLYEHIFSNVSDNHTLDVNFVGLT